MIPVDDKINQFIDTVVAMRKAQKAYFKSRKQEDLIAAKRLETAVDLRIGAIKDANQDPTPD